MEKYIKAIESGIFSEKETTHIKGVYDFANLVSDLKDNTSFFEDNSTQKLEILIHSLHVAMDVSKRDYHNVVSKIFCYDNDNELNEFALANIQKSLFSIDSPIQNIYGSFLPPNKYTYMKVELNLNEPIKEQVFEKLIDPSFSKKIDAKLLEIELKNCDVSNASKTSAKRKI